MIFVDGVPFSTHSSSTCQGNDILLALLENPILVSASSSFKANPERKFSVSEESSTERSKWVYIFQREYATVKPAFIDFVGTDEATTCVGLVIRNRRNGMTSVAHIDLPEIVEMGLSQMLSLLVDDSLETELDVHLIGGFEDVSLQQANGYSFPLCSKIVHTLWAREEKFHIQTVCVLGHNTGRDPDRRPFPFFNGFLVETTTGIVIPASFDRSSRCPDEIVRRIRVSASNEDTNWNGKLLETYDTSNDRFKIAPCRWTLCQDDIASSHQHYSDSQIPLNCSTSPTAEGPDFVDSLRRTLCQYCQYCIASLHQHDSDSQILEDCSTSPNAEGPDFVDGLRRKWNYLIEHPYWTETFPREQPRIFERGTDGRWKVDKVLMTS